MCANDLTLAQAARISPGKPAPSTIWRWCRKGIATRSGERIKLEHIRAGGRVFTTEENLRRFFNEVAASDLEYFATDKPQPTKRPTSKRRQASVERAQKTLEQAGIA